MGNCGGKTKQKKKNNQQHIQDKNTLQSTLAKTERSNNNIKKEQEKENNTNNNNEIEKQRETPTSPDFQKPEIKTQEKVTDQETKGNIQENNLNNEQNQDEITKSGQISIQNQKIFAEILKDDQIINSNDRKLINSFIDRSLSRTIFDKQVLQEEQKNIDQNGDNYFNDSQVLFYGEKLQKEKQRQQKKMKKQKNDKTIRWKEGKPLGSGSFGKVVEGMNQDTGEIMAVKQISRQDIPCKNDEQKAEMLEALKLEIELLKNLQHKNIVKYIGVTYNKETETLNIFLEYVAQGSINTVIEKYGKTKEVMARNYMQNILEGLEYLHSHNIVHRDIKGANILVDSGGVCKLADFGSSKRLVNNQQQHEGKLEQIKGTVNWMAPEVIRQKEVGRFADIWSLGCTLLEMLTGQMPFHQYTNPLTAMFYIGQGNIKPNIPEELSAEVKDFLNKCFEIEPQKRPNVCQLLKHPFILSGKRHSSNIQALQVSDSKPKRLSGSDQGVNGEIQDTKMKNIIISRQNINQQARDKRKNSKQSILRSSKSNLSVQLEVQRSPQHRKNTQNSDIGYKNQSNNNIKTPPQRYSNLNVIDDSNLLLVNDNGSKQKAFKKCNSPKNKNYMIIKKKSSNASSTQDSQLIGVKIQQASDNQKQTQKNYNEDIIMQKLNKELSVLKEQKV